MIRSKEKPQSCCRYVLTVPPKSTMSIFSGSSGDDQSRNTLNVFGGDDDQGSSFFEDLSARGADDDPAPLHDVDLTTPSTPSRTTGVSWNPEVQTVSPGGAVGTAPLAFDFMLHYPRDLFNSYFGAAKEEDDREDDESDSTTSIDGQDAAAEGENAAAATQ